MEPNEAADLIEAYENEGGKWVGKMGEAHRLAVAALRTPPATGAVAMREALIEVARRALADCAQSYMHTTDLSHAERVVSEYLAALPVPGVPEAVIEWSLIADKGGSDCERYAADMALRYYFSEAYGVKP